MFHITCYILLLSKIFLSEALSSANLVEPYKEDLAIKRLQDYIQIDTSVLENAEFAVEFWRRQANELGLNFAVYRPDELPICVITLKGRQPELPSIMLNSHADVVPADADEWIYSPYSGHIDENGDLYGRGTQDTKGVGIQYIEAIRKLIQNNVTLERTVHITVMPDEETGGFRGMVPFVDTEEFKSLNIGFALDEGSTSDDNIMFATYQDKRPWQVKFNVHGDGGHGSTMTNGTAVEGLQKLINNAMIYRNAQMKIMNSKERDDFGAYTTININIVEGGVASNVIPTNITVVMDMRLSVASEVKDVDNMLNSWLSELSDESTIEFLRRLEYSPASAVDDSNPYWRAMEETMKELGITIEPIVCPATTDMVVIRAKAIPALGFSTKTNMIARLHDVNEYIPVNNFLEGIDIYVALLKKLGNLPDNRA